jgi:diacylglycerol kinase family enzyme
VPRLLAGLNGSLGRMKGSHELRAPWLELHHDEPLAVHLDGNQDELPPPVSRFEVLSGALSIAVPAIPDS